MWSAEASAGRPLSTTPGDLVLFGKSTLVGGLDLRHLVDREAEAVGDGGDVVDFVERKLPALAGLQVFVDHLVSADVEIPHRLRHGLEKLRLVDRDRLFLRPFKLRHYRNFVLWRQFIAGPSLGLTGTIPGVVSFLWTQAGSHRSRRRARRLGPV